MLIPRLIEKSHAWDYFILMRAKKLIKAANSKAKMKINNVQYRLIISKLMAFLFLRRSLERFVEESKTNCYHFHRIKRRKKKNKKSKNVRYRKHSAINVKYPLWNIPWHLPPRTGIRPVFTEVSSLPLGPPHWSLSCSPTVPHPHMAFYCTCPMFTELLSARSIILITIDKDGDKESLRE